MEKLMSDVYNKINHDLSRDISVYLKVIEKALEVTHTRLVISLSKIREQFVLGSREVGSKGAECCLYLYWSGGWVYTVTLNQTKK